MKPGDRFRFKNQYTNLLLGEGVVYEVLDGMGRKHKDTYIRGLFHNEEYDPGESVYLDGVLQYVEMDNAITFGIDELELVE
jgi:hypothetical protein